MRFRRHWLVFAFLGAALASCEPSASCYCASKKNAQELIEIDYLNADGKIIQGAFGKHTKEYQQTIFNQLLKADIAPSVALQLSTSIFRAGADYDSIISMAKKDGFNVPASSEHTVRRIPFAKEIARKVNKIIRENSIKKLSKMQDNNRDICNEIINNTLQSAQRYDVVFHIDEINIFSNYCKKELELKTGKN